MTEQINGGKAIQKGLIYHANNFLTLQDSLESIDIEDQEQDSKLRRIVEDLNHEAIAYFNRIGQFYYFARSEHVAEIVNDYKMHIPNILRLKEFRMKQSAHRATDAPKGENTEYMAQLDRLFTYQFLLFDKKILYQILLEEPDQNTGRKSINFWMHEDHLKITEETDNFLELLRIN